MLGRMERESPAHAATAARQAGWAGLVVPDGADAAADSGEPEEVELLDLGGIRATLDTVATIADLSAVVYLGHPEQPNPLLEEALLAADPNLVLTAATAVESQWVWAGHKEAHGGAIIIDEAGLRDCRDVLRSIGVTPRLVPSRMSPAQRAAIAGPDGSLLIERSRIPEGCEPLPGSHLFSSIPHMWYGLLQSRDDRPAFRGSAGQDAVGRDFVGRAAAVDALAVPSSVGDGPPVDGPAQVWLAFGPSSDYRGSLRESLGLVADAGVDLQHLRSQAQTGGPHHFFTSFSCPSADVLDSLVAQLEGRGVAHRIVAVLPGQDFVPGPATLTPRWTAGDRA